MDYETLERLVSRERAETYLELANNPSVALALYDWNRFAAGAFLTDLAIVEVAFRNVLDQCLQSWSARQNPQEDWIQDASLRASLVHGQPPPIDGNLDRALTKARQRAHRKKKNSLTRGHILAEVTLGIWPTFLAAGKHHQLWLPCLRYGFLAGTNRETLRESLQRLVETRNRATHHEPLGTVTLWGALGDMRTVLGHISATAEEWLCGTSALYELLSPLGRPESTS